MSSFENENALLKILRECSAQRKKKMKMIIIVTIQAANASISMSPPGAPDGLLAHTTAGPRRGLPPDLCWKIRSIKSGILERKWSNFRGLVLFCIEADSCNQILIFSIFQYLQDSHTFAPLPIRSSRKNSSAKNRDFSTIFIEFWSDFDNFFSGFRWTF